MDKIVFVEKSRIPNEQLFISTLKETFEYYTEIFKQLKQMKPNIWTEWKYYGKKNGWLLKHLDDKRNVFFLVPHEGFFKLSFTFGDKAVCQIIASDTISSHIKELIQAAKKYSEGTPILLTVKSENDVGQAIELVKYKLC